MNHGCRFGGVLTSVAAITAVVATGVAAFNYASTGCPLSSSCSTAKAACSTEKSSTAAVQTVAAKSGGCCSLMTPAVTPVAAKSDCSAAKTDCGDKAAVTTVAAKADCGSKAACGSTQAVANASDCSSKSSCTASAAMTTAAALPACPFERFQVLAVASMHTMKAKDACTSNAACSTAVKNASCKEMKDGCEGDGKESCCGGCGTKEQKAEAGSKPVTVSSIR